MASSLEFSSIVSSSKESPSVGHLGFQRSPEGSIPHSTNVRFQQCFKVRATQVSASADAISRPGHMEVQSLYEVLGVSQGATAKDNKTAYRKLAREFHPDHAASPQMRPLPSANSVEAVLFDVDGTLVDSDPLHFLTFRDMLQEVGFQGGIPITEEFFSKNISGNHNDDIGAKLFPDWDESQRQKFTDDKEAVFRSKAVENLKPVNGLHKLCKWIENSGLRRAAVTNAPRENAELMISIVGLTDFFELLVIGSECERAKPFPDPYLKALEHFNIPSSRAFALEDSPSGLKAAVAAGLAVAGLTTRNPGQELIDAGATLVIKDFEDLDLWNALES